VVLYDLDSDKAFLVSLKALIIEGDRVLVLENAAEKWGRKAQWELPGGLLEIGEDLEEGLLREVREETCLEVSVGGILAAWDHWEHGFRLRDGRVLDARIIEIAFACRLVSGDIKVSDEHTRYRWATAEELRQLDFSPNSRGAITAHLEDYNALAKEFWGNMGFEPF